MSSTAGREIRRRWERVRGPLFTDLYELVMAQIYVREGMADDEAQFDYFFRSAPDYGTHRAGYCVTAGLRPLLRWLRELAFGPAELEALAAMRGSGGEPAFDRRFLDWLADADRWRALEIDAVPEGRVVHPHEPIVSVTGPLAAAQLIETALLNHLNYPTLVATKAARVVGSAHGGAVLEFGMRRGPGAGVDDGVRAALIAGCAGTSDVEASVALGARPRGTHAHSLVQAYLAAGAGELEAFRAMARVAPDDCVLLVDTVDTLHSGMPKAITVFGELRAAGHRPAGVRLDSGDLASLAVQAARQLDDAGFEEVPIVLSGDLDELRIEQLHSRLDELADEPSASARLRRRLVYGVGTRLITSHGDAALDGVYKLVGLRRTGQEWTPAIKISEEPGKVPVPGRKRVWRLHDRRGVAVADLIALPDEDPLDGETIVAHHPTRADLRTVHHREALSSAEELHHRVAADVGGEDAETLDELRERCRRDVERLDAGVRRLVDPDRYEVALSDRLHRLRLDLIERTRGR